VFDEVGGAEGLREVAALFNTALDLENQAFLLNSLGTIESRCMRRAGYAGYQVARIDPQDLYPPGADFTDLDLWLLDDLEEVRRVGYGFVQSVRDRRATSFDPDGGGDPYDTSRMTAEERAAFDLALFGSPDEYVTYVESEGSTDRVRTGGCVGQARATIYGDVAEWFRLRSLRSDLEAELWPRVRSDRGLRSALGAWSRCMGDRGFDVRAPDDAAELVGSSIGERPLEEVQALEVEIAVADLECRREVDLLRFFGAAYVTAAREVLAEWEDDLVAFRRLEQEAVERAKAALAETGP